MAGILDRFRNTIQSSVWKYADRIPKPEEINDKIALGVLLWAVAEADSKFLPREEEEIKESLRRYSTISDKDMDVVLATIRHAAKERIDLYRFTSEVAKGLTYSAKKQIVEQLFRVGCSDMKLEETEIETIRKISDLLDISHKDFIDAKLRIKKEFGLDAASKGGFFTLIGMILAIAIIALLMYFVVNTYLKQPKGMDKDTAQELRKHDIDPSNYQTILDSTRQKMDQINKQRMRRFDQLEQTH
jgi:uncharacterized tellurite resistance protein B-like protein